MMELNQSNTEHCHSVKTIPSKKDLSKKVIIKVKGSIYETFQSTLQRYPLTRLGSQTKRDELAKDSGMVILDCDAQVFDAILFYYQSFGILRCPIDVKMHTFVAECRKLEINERDIKEMQEREGFLYEEPFIENQRQHIPMKLWRLLESPESSLAASIFAIINCLMIAASTCLTCIQTLPYIRNSDSSSFTENPILMTEFSLNLFFAVEYILRVISSPDKIKFVRSLLNIIEFFAVYPYFAILIVDSNNVSSANVLSIIRSARFLRLIRLTKHSKALETAINIMRNCISDVATMISTIFISCLIGGTLEYCAEANVKGTRFTNLPQSLWWAAQTVIPVGYGDIVPQSTMGKIVGGFVVVMSSLTFALPLLFLGGTFLKYYSKSFGMADQDDVRDARKDSKPL